MWGCKRYLFRISLLPAVEHCTAVNGTNSKTYLSHLKEEEESNCKSSTHIAFNIVKLVLCIQLTPREQWAVCARLGNDSRSHQMPLVKVTDWGTNIMCVFQWWGKPESSEEAQGERINSAEKGPAPVGFNPRTLWLWGNSVNNQKFKYSLIAAL